MEQTPSVAVFHVFLDKKDSKNKWAKELQINGIARRETEKENTPKHSNNTNQLMNSTGALALAAANVTKAQRIVRAFND